MRTYLATTFSPAMLSVEGGVAKVVEVDEAHFIYLVKKALSWGTLCPAVGHENTARLLALRLQKEGVEVTAEEGAEETFVPLNLFSRASLTLKQGDELLAAIPQFRAPEAREFSDEEIEQAKFRFFLIEVL